MLVRSYREADREQVIGLFRAFMDEYARPEFAEYVERAIRDELGNIASYYGGERQGFWVAELGEEIVGMTGIERHSYSEAELRRMVVARSHRRRGIARALLGMAETFCREAGYSVIVLNTSELQGAAMQLYESSGYRRVRTAAPEGTTHKRVGGLVRHYYEKAL